MTKTPTINRRGWLALWLQRRRRVRAVALTLDAPTLGRAGGYYVGTSPVPASVWQFAQSDSGYDSGPIQGWVDGCDLPTADYELLSANQARSVQIFYAGTCRYQVAGVWSPWCAII